VDPRLKTAVLETIWGWTETYLFALFYIFTNGNKVSNCAQRLINPFIYPSMTLAK